MKTQTLDSTCPVPSPSRCLARVTPEHFFPSFGWSGHQRNPSLSPLFIKEKEKEERGKAEKGEGEGEAGEMELLDSDLDGTARIVNNASSVRS